MEKSKKSILGTKKNNNGGVLRFLKNNSAIYKPFLGALFWREHDKLVIGLLETKPNLTNSNSVPLTNQYYPNLLFLFLFFFFSFRNE